MTKRRVAVYRGDVPQLAEQLAARLSAGGIAVSVDREQGGEDLVVGLFTSSGSARIRYQEGTAPDLRAAARALGEGSGWRVLPMYVPALRERRRATATRDDGPAVRIEVPRALPGDRVVAGVEAGLRCLWDDDGGVGAEDRTGDAAATPPGPGGPASARAEAGPILLAATASVDDAPAELDEGAGSPQADAATEVAGSWEEGEVLHEDAPLAAEPADETGWRPTEPGTDGGSVQPADDVGSGEEPAGRGQAAVGRVEAHAPREQGEVDDGPPGDGDWREGGERPHASLHHEDDAASHDRAAPETVTAEASGREGIGDDGASDLSDRAAAASAAVGPDREGISGAEPAEAHAVEGWDQEEDVAGGEDGGRDELAADEPSAEAASADRGMDDRPATHYGTADASRLLSDSSLSLALAIVEYWQRAAASGQPAAPAREAGERPGAAVVDADPGSEPTAWGDATGSEEPAEASAGEAGDGGPWPDAPDLAAGEAGADSWRERAAGQEGDAAPWTDGEPSTAGAGADGALPEPDAAADDEAAPAPADELHAAESLSLAVGPQAAEDPFSDDGPLASMLADDPGETSESLSPAAPSATEPPGPGLAHVQRLVSPAAASSLPPGFGPFGIGRTPGEHDVSSRRSGRERRTPDGRKPRGATPGQGPRVDRSPGDRSSQATAAAHVTGEVRDAGDPGPDRPAPASEAGRPSGDAPASGGGRERLSPQPGATRAAAPPAPTAARQGRVPPARVQSVVLRTTVTPMQVPLPPGGSAGATHPFRVAAAPAGSGVPFRPTDVRPPTGPAMLEPPATAKVGVFRSWPEPTAPPAGAAEPDESAPAAGDPAPAGDAVSHPAAPTTGGSPNSGGSMPDRGWPAPGSGAGSAGEHPGPQPAGNSAFMPGLGGGWLPAVAPMVGPPGPNARRLAEAHILVPFR